MTTRARAADEMVALLDSPFLRALTEPARLEVLKALLLHGPADVSAIAARVPQDRSVVSRHLKSLEEVGVVRATRGAEDARQRVYAIDASGFITTLEGILGRVRALAPVCCPPPSPPKRRRG